MQGLFILVGCWPDCFLHSLFCVISSEAVRLLSSIVFDCLLGSVRTLHNVLSAAVCEVGNFGVACQIPISSVIHGYSTLAEKMDNFSTDEGQAQRPSPAPDEGVVAAQRSSSKSDISTTIAMYILVLLSLIVN